MISTYVYSGSRDPAHQKVHVEHVNFVHSLKLAHPRQQILQLYDKDLADAKAINEKYVANFSANARDILHMFEFRM